MYAIRSYYEVIVTAEDVGDPDPSARNRQDGKDHQGDGHRIRGLVDVLLHLRVHPGRSEKGQEHEAEPIEGRDPRGGRPAQPQALV